MERKQPIDLAAQRAKRRFTRQIPPVDGTLALKPSPQITLNTEPQTINNLIYFPAKGSILFDQRPERKVKEPRAKIVGFDSSWEIDTFQKNYQRGLSDGKSKFQAATDAYREIEENARSHTKEYAEGKLVFFTYYHQNEKGRVVDQTGYPVADKINPQERMGQPKRVWEQEIEPFLVTNNAGIAITISSVGPTNIRDGEGNLIDFADTYFQIATKVNGEIRFITIRTDLSLNEARRALQSLILQHNPRQQIPPESNNAYIESSNIIGTAVLIKTEENQNAINQHFFDLITSIEKINPEAFGESKSSQTAFLEYLNLDKGFNLSPECQKYMNQLRELIFSNLDTLDLPEIRYFIEQQISETMLKITLAVHGRSPTGVNGHLSQEDIKWGIATMQTYRGCFGNGTKAKSFIITAGGIREVSLSNQTQQEKWETAYCGGCKRTMPEVSCGLCKSCAQNWKFREALGL